MLPLGELPGGEFRSQATGVSADGLVVVGESATTSGPEAFMWTSEGGMEGLGVLGTASGGAFESIARAVSADGSIIVGKTSSVSGIEAFRWTSETGLVGLGDLDGPPFQSRAFARP